MSSKSKALFKIHPPVKNPNNIYAAAAQTEKNDVRTRAEFVVSCPYFGAGPSDSRICRNSLNVPPKPADINFRLINAPLTRCIVPDFLKV